MAKLHEEYAIVKISQLTKSNSEPTSIITDDFNDLLIATVESALEQLGIQGCVVEIDNNAE
jgi:hypothetical protein